MRSPNPDGGAGWTPGDDMGPGFSFAACGAGANYKQPVLPLPGAANAETSLQVLDLVLTFNRK